jgi:hypothetical protein
MKTTFVLDDGVMTQLREEAARQGRTLSELVEAALRAMLSAKPTPAKRLPKLPVFDSGGALVDITDRDALYDVMDER